MEEELIYYSNGENILFCNTNNQFIPKIVESYFINKNLENTCELFSAPKKWLIENNYDVISKPKKNKLKKVKQ